MQSSPQAPFLKPEPRRFSPVQFFERFALPEWIALLVYVIWVAVTIAHHEPWADEAQSWLLGRDSPFWYTQLNRVHYEATPGLWAAMLWVLAHVGVSYAGMHWLTGLFGVALTVLILGASPFPRWVRLLLPFSASFLYQGPVVARSYSMAVLLIVMLAWLYRQERRSLGWPLVMCALLALSSLFGMFIAFGFAVLFVVQAWRSQRKVPWMFAGSMAAVLVIATWQAFPAPDLDFGIAGTLSAKPATAKLMARITGIPVAQSKGVSLEAPPVPVPEFHHAWQQRLFLYTHKTKPKPLAAALATQALIFTSILSYSVSSFALLAVAFYIVLLVWMARQGKLLLALPLLLLAVLAHLLRLTDHHALLLWATIAATVWMGWPVTERRDTLELTFRVLLLCVLVEQAAWSVSCSVRDDRGAFDAGQQLAAYLQRPEMQGKRIATTAYASTSAEPYFAHDPFLNKRASYWQWQSQYDPDYQVPQALSMQPDVVVGSEQIVGDSLTMNEVIPWLRVGSQSINHTALSDRGWHQVARFCGKQPQQFGYAWEICDTVWLPPGK